MASAGGGGGARGSSMSVASELADGLRARTSGSRARAARRLVQYVRSELRELPPDQVARFLDDFNHHILEMVSAPDFNDKKAGVLAIVCLISGDCDTTKTRISRYANYLRNLFPSSDVSVMELAAKTVGRLAVISGAKRAEYVEFEVRRAFEWLSSERNEGKRHAAVLILRELAVAMPTYFHQQVSGFFDHIFIALKDSKPLIREAGSKALQAGLVVTAQRESARQTHKPQWYNQCYKEAKNCLDNPSIKEKGINQDDRWHSGLLILNELLRCSHAAWERKYTHLMQTLDTQQEVSLTEDIIPIMPRIKSHLNSRGSHIDHISSSSDSNSQPTTIYESAVCRQLITENYDIICPIVLNCLFSRSSHVQQIFMIILPRLAAFNKDDFIKNYLNATLQHLLITLRGREKDRNMAFTTVGLISIAVEIDIMPWVGRIMDVIKMALPSNDTPSKKKSGMDPAVFICISLLANSVREVIAVDVKDMLEQMKVTGLSPALTVCLRELAQSIPSLKEDISEALLNMLSIVLMNKPLLHPGLPKNIEQQMSNSSNMYETHDVSSIVLALRTLGSFDFEGHSLLPFVKYCANNFLHSEHQEIRLEAVRTCSRLLSIPIQSELTEQSNMVKCTVASVLSKLLVVGITDTDCDVRYWVLASLDETFDSYLAQIENLSSLFIAMNDEVLEIREIAICTIGRLSTVNPAYVIPSLRKTLIQFLTELEHSGMSRNKEQSARMLDHLIVSAPRLIRPYMEPILNVLVPKLKETDSNPGVILSVLRAIGDLAEVNGDSNGLNKWMPELLSILLELLADASSPVKRNVALWAFGQLISATGQVVTPYSQFPNLMDVLINFLKTEQQIVIRRETIRVLGLLGALDPYKHKISRGLIDGQVDSNHSSLADSKVDENNFNMNTSEMLVNMSSSMLDEYYPAIAISTLMRIIRDPNLSQHHTSVVQAVTFIFQSLGIKCVPYISQVMPSLLYVVRMADSAIRDFLFTQLATLIAIVKQHIRNYLDKIFELIKEFWTPNSPLQTTLILLVEHIAVALGAEFKIYLPQLIPQIMRVLLHDSSKDRAVTVKLLLALQKFGDNLDDYLHLILPAIVRLFDANDCPIAVCRAAMETVDHLADSLDFTDLTSRIVHPLVRSLETCPELRSTAMDTLCALVVQLGRKYNHFIPLVQKVINKHKIPSQKYEVLVSKLQSNTTLAVDEDFLITRHYNARHNNQEISLTSSDTTTIKKLQVNPVNLRLAWTASRRVSKDDWLEWLRNLSIGLLKESQSPALRSCLALAQNYSQLLRDLFNAAFVSCWTELKADMQSELVIALEQALTAPDLPEITQTILNLAEFMEHCDRGPLPIQTQLLGERAMQCRAYAKALHYKEEEFRRDVNSHAVESLILINNKLQQREAAEGLLEFVMTRRAAGHMDLQVQVRWYEKLHSWEKALNLYSDELEASNDIEARLGQMRCLEALGEWGELHRVAGENWDTFLTEDRGRAGRLAAAAAWGLGDWDSMQHYVQCIPSDSQDGAFYRAVLAVHAGQFSQAQQLVEQTRDLLDTELTAMAGESYQRAYSAMVWVQMLAELEEVMQYKLVPERRSAIRSMWWARLQGGQKLVEDWQRIIRVHRLVINPRDDMHTWLKYASLCRKSGSLKLAHKTLVMLLGIDPSLQPDEPLPFQHPQVTLAYCKQLWVDGKRTQALSQLQRFVDSYQEDSIEDTERRQLVARCYLKLGAWRESEEGVTEASIPVVLQCYSSATDYAPEWYKAWHAWAYMNFETVLLYKLKYGDSASNIPGTTGESAQYVSKFTVPAVEGFFKSINLSHGNSLQDTLRLLTLWFDYGQWPEVHEAIMEGIRTIEINTWLQVIPQLIARIDTPRALGRLIHSLLIDIGKSHPQALVYPLSVASKSSFVARRNAANQVLKSMCTHSANLVSQAMMASEELIRVAILWHEQWHEGLEEASRLYFGEENIRGMLETLEPLHAMLERGPQTLKETSFNQAYGKDLMEAQDWCNRYKVSRKVSDLNQAWDLYYHVFRRISRQLPQLTSLELQYVSPKLLNCTNLELAVPGTYRPGQEVVRIGHIQSSLQVITSKQRPRRLCIHGSNGKDYLFLLKGHEDLRQDERVMQLFGLANTLLQNDPDTFRRNLTIQRYAVIPLSTNSGLIGWVPHCDTLHSLIRDYRERKKCLLNIEHRLMLRMTVDYDRLMLMQKVEVFEHALEHTAGDDLARLLWLKSPSSEVWFERRTNYTRSLAVMSMVGYILGLGDRHPSNLMLDRITGKILHIDFGDCFEVAVTRDKFPEKIPFRLTRMLINAMEVTGIEGTYRRTCESVMAVLHRNKDSLMAVLEAFVHDPLLNWRLMDTTRRSRDASLGTGNSAGESTSLSIPAPLPRRPLPGPEGQPEALNKKALAIISRVRDKLTGRDFNPDEILTVAKQVDLLIQQATSNENLCQCYIGWCPFW